MSNHIDMKEAKMRCSCDRYGDQDNIHDAGCDFYYVPCPNCEKLMVRGRAVVPGAGMISMWLCDCNEDDLANLGGEYSKIKDYLGYLRNGGHRVMGLALGELAGTMKIEQ